MFENQYPATQTQEVLLRKSTVTERLLHERETLTKRLSEIDKALTALQANPQIQEVIDMLAKLY